MDLQISVIHCICIPQHFINLQERERLSHKLERMRLKRRRLAAEKGNGTKVVEDLDDQVPLKHKRQPNRTVRIKSGFRHCCPNTVNSTSTIQIQPLIKIGRLWLIIIKIHKSFLIAVSNP